MSRNNALPFWRSRRRRSPAPAPTCISTGRDTVSFAAGDAVAVNKITQMIDPWPPYAGNRNIAFDGERMQAAAERYRTNKVTPLATAATSSVQYARCWRR